MPIHTCIEVEVIRNGHKDSKQTIGRSQKLLHYVGFEPTTFSVVGHGGVMIA